MRQITKQLPAPPGAKSRQHVTVGRSPHFLSSLVAAVIMLAGLLPGVLLAQSEPERPIESERSECHRGDDERSAHIFDGPDDDWTEVPWWEREDEGEHADKYSDEPYSVVDQLPTDDQLKHHCDCQSGGWVYDNGVYRWVCHRPTGGSCPHHLSGEGALVVIGVVAGAAIADSLLSEGCALTAGASGAGPWALLASVLAGAWLLRQRRMLTPVSRS